MRVFFLMQRPCGPICRNSVRIARRLRASEGITPQRWLWTGIGRICYADAGRTGRRGNGLIALQYTAPGIVKNFPEGSGNKDTKTGGAYEMGDRNGETVETACRGLCGYAGRPAVRSGTLASAQGRLCAAGTAARQNRRAALRQSAKGFCAANIRSELYVLLKIWSAWTCAARRPCLSPWSCSKSGREADGGFTPRRAGCIMMMFWRREWR